MRGRGNCSGSRGAPPNRGRGGGKQAGRRSGRTVPNGQADHPQGAPIHAVFDQPELLELILDYAIHDKSAETRLKTLRSVRLVNKTWLTELTNVMRKNKEPLFKLTLTKDNSLDGAPFVAAQGKLLDQFVAAVGRRIEEPFPTFKLNILEEFFRLENYDSLVTCLRLCGQGLVALKMIIPENGGSLPGRLPPVDLDLPIMQELRAAFTNHKPADKLMENELTITDCANVISMIQSLFNGASSLKNFTVPFYGPGKIAIRAPRFLEFLTFPETITKLKLGCEMTSENLEVLTRNKLPNLSTLKLVLKNVSYTEGLFSKVRSNFSEHLRTLIASGSPGGYNGPPRHVNFVQFPVMKKLTSLELYYAGLELVEGHPLLSDCFPELKRLILYDHTLEMLRKWTSDTGLKSVLCWTNF